MNPMFTSLNVRFVLAGMVSKIVSLRARELSATLAAEFAAKCAGGWPNEGYCAFGCLRSYFWGIKGRAGQVLSFKILT
jgi:hypothetical protein